MTPVVLVVEGNTRAASAAVIAAGGRAAADLYAATLTGLRPEVRCEVVRPADADSALPAGGDLGQFAGIAWTGSGLNIYQGGSAVERQVALMRAAFASGTPIFGSCWGLQVATAAAGGVVRANPRGREIGVARKIALTAAGRAHPLYAGKPAVFDALCVHRDEVATAAPGTTVLAGNAWSGIQAAEIVWGGGCFWGVQYHPEYDLREIAGVLRRYGPTLVGEGLLAEPEEGERLAGMFEELERDPGRRDLAWMLGVDGDVLDPAVRLAELANWLDAKVIAGMAGR